MATQTLDIAILGGGMVGSLLARQLSRELPDRRIAVFERKPAYSHNLGESMVEIASNYFIRRLGLGSYLYDRHYPKNGLRFFFDSQARDTPLHEMSEIGSTGLPYLPAFQVDRSRLEADLVELNARAGVPVRLGTSVRCLELGKDGAPHRFMAVNGVSSHEYESRWVIDATGRSRMIARLEGLHVPETALDNASIWGWFEGVADVDSLGPDSFRARVNYTARRLSTLHFLYRGYWIWFIPLKNGITSVGVVCEKEHYDRRYCSKEGFLEFLRQHEAVASLLRNATPVVTREFPHLAYGTRRFYSPHRWGLVGESSAFPDPYYSPGADFIALGNDFVSDLIVRDLRGEDEAALMERLELYEAFMQFRVEAALRLYRGQYPLFGSYEACKLKWDLDIGCYYNLWLSAFLHDEHLSLRWLKRQLYTGDATLTALSNFAALFRQVETHLTAKGAYHRRNAGEFSDGQDCLDFARQLGTRRTSRETLRTTEDIFNAVRDRALDVLQEVREPVARRRVPLSWFMRARDLAIEDPPG